MFTDVAVWRFYEGLLQVITMCLPYSGDQDQESWCTLIYPIQKKKKKSPNIKGRSRSFSTLGMIDMRPMVLWLLSVIHTETNDIAYKFGGLVKHLPIKMVSSESWTNQTCSIFFSVSPFLAFMLHKEPFSPPYLTFQT